jgi:hypothetical protein
MTVELSRNPLAEGELFRLSWIRTLEPISPLQLSLSCHQSKNLELERCFMADVPSPISQRNEFGFFFQSVNWSLSKNHFPVAYFLRFATAAS